MSDSPTKPTTDLCDCERSHNGFGIVGRECDCPAGRAWNGGSPEAAARDARQRTEDAIASGCERCQTCHGEGLLDELTICPQCGAAGFLVPPCGMPLPRERKDMQ